MFEKLGRSKAWPNQASPAGSPTEISPRASERAVGRLDEIGRLPQAFNAMLSHLQRLMRQQHETAASEQGRLNLLVATRTEELRRETDERKRSEALVAETRIRDARSAGMAEVATGVLHNVGNALNSVGVSAELIGDKLRRSRLPGLVKANGLLGAHTEDLGSFLTEHPQGKQLPGYLAKLGAELTFEQQGLVQELEGLRKGLAHITSIVSAQQSLAKGGAASREPIQPSVLFEEALALGLPVSDRSGLEISTDFPPTEPMALDRHRLIQILVNLIGNANHALGKLLPEQRSLALSVRAGRGQADLLGARQRHRHSPRAAGEDLLARLHHQEGQSRVWPSRQRLCRDGAGWLAQLSQRRRGAARSRCELPISKGKALKEAA